MTRVLPINGHLSFWSCTFPRSFDSPLNKLISSIGSLDFFFILYFYINSFSFSNHRAFDFHSSLPHRMKLRTINFIINVLIKFPLTFALILEMKKFLFLWTFITVSDATRLLLPSSRYVLSSHATWATMCRTWKSWGRSWNRALHGIAAKLYTIS